MSLRRFFKRYEEDAELACEVEAHLAHEIDDNLASGMSEEEARRQAYLKLGNPRRIREKVWEINSLEWLEDTLRDVRYAVRALARTPGFTCTAILMLALGFGASVAIFAFVDSALIKPLPYQRPTRLVDVTETALLMGRANLSYLDYRDWKRLNKVFSSLEVYTGRGYLLNTPTGSEPVPGARVSDGFFRTLGITPVLGRDFYAGEDSPGAPRTVILSYDAWQRRFGGSKDVIGKTVSLSGVPSTVIGVLPPDFQFAPRGAAEFWAPLNTLSECDLRRSCHNLNGVARLKDGISVEAALSDMQSIARQLEMQFPGDNRGQGATVLPLSEVIVGEVRPILLTLLGGVSLLLMIAYVNVSSLLLVRSENRKREIAVRGALGASRTRLIRQFITEGLVLAASGSALGLAVAYGAIRILASLMPKDMMAEMPYLRGPGLSLHVLSFAGAIALLAVVLFSLAPIVRLPLNALQDGLTEGGRASAGTTWRRFGASLVVIELATALVLLVAAGLLSKSFYRLLHVEIGFQPNHLATLQVALPEVNYQKDEQVVSFGRKIVSRIESLPGVRSAAITSVLPVSFNGNTEWIRFVGRPYHGEHNEVNMRDVSSGFFTTMQAKLLRGRFFTEDEDASKPLVVVINQALAKKYFPGEDPIGRRIGDDGLSPKSIKEVIGVVNDIRDGSLDSEIWPAVYYPFNQNSDQYFAVVVRTSQDEKSLLPTLGTAIHQIDPGVGTIDEATMNDRISSSPSAYLHRSSAWLVGSFATLALLLGVVGLYGVISYSVSQRTREIGVRMALGAQRSTVYRLILREAGWLTSVGVALGLLCAIAASTLISKLLFGIHSWDLPTLAAAAVALTISALLASFIPARRAASVNPVEALRAE
jgi:macrolide transport system ATP-binding/permease protein